LTHQITRDLIALFFIFSAHNQMSFSGERKSNFRDVRDGTATRDVDRGSDMPLRKSFRISNVGHQGIGFTAKLGGLRRWEDGDPRGFRQRRRTHGGRYVSFETDTFRMNPIDPEPNTNSKHEQ
jgi:hypothetical protein